MKKQLEIDLLMSHLDQYILKHGSKILTLKGLTKEITSVELTINPKELFKLDYDEKEYRIEFGNAEKQLEKISLIISNDNNSRQAIIYNKSKTKAPACNSFFQFLLRKKKLDMYCYLRSSDITRLKNDVISLSQLLKKLSKKLNVKTGEIHLYIVSLHKYV